MSHHNAVRRLCNRVANHLAKPTTFAKPLTLLFKAILHMASVGSPNRCSAPNCRDG